MMKKLNAKISIKKKIKKLENKIEELQRGEEEEPPSPLLEQPKRDKIKKRKSKVSQLVICPLVQVFTVSERRQAECGDRSATGGHQSARAAD